MNGNTKQTSLLGAAATLIAAVSIWGVNVAYNADEKANHANRKSDEAILKAEQARPYPWTSLDQQRRNIEHAGTHRDERTQLDRWILVVLESMKNEIWSGVPPQEVDDAINELRKAMSEHDKRITTIETQMYGPRR